MTQAGAQGEYLVKVTVRNNLILRRMKELGITRQEDLAQLSGISQPAVSALIGMRIRAVNIATGDWSDHALRLSAALRVEPEELWTAKQRDMRLDRSSREVSMSEDAVMQLASGLGPERMAQNALTSEQIDAALDTLDARERDALKSRFFDGATFDDIGRDYGISRERARQVVMRALRKLRHPSRAPMLKQHLEDYNT
jgi:RNA polymerase sigma factor (sigma-70 family)